MGSRAADIAGGLGDIADPSVRVVLLVIRGVSDFQVLYCEPGHIIHRDLKVHRNGSDLFAAFSSCGLSQGYLGYEAVLNTALELFDRPFGHLLLWLVLEALTLDTLR